VLRWKRFVDNERDFVEIYSQLFKDITLTFVLFITILFIAYEKK